MRVSMQILCNTHDDYDYNENIVNIKYVFTPPQQITMYA